MSTTPLYSQEIINIGANPNDGTGDPLRVAFDKINNNFSNLFPTLLNSTVAYTFGNTQGQVIFEAPVSEFSQGQFYVKSIANGTPDTQNIQLFAQLDNTNANVKFTAYGTTIFGNALTRYDMVVASGNVQVLVNPLLNEDMTHLINSQIMYISPSQVGANLTASGYSGNVVLTTENNVNLTQ